jgi:hypothetical protein
LPDDEAEGVVGANGPGDAPECPFCGARDSEPVSSFGLSLMTTLRRCRQCRADFEAVKWT